MEISEKQISCIDAVLLTTDPLASLYSNRHISEIQNIQYLNPVQTMKISLASSRVRVVLISERAVSLLAPMATSIHLNSQSSQAVPRRQRQGATAGIGLDTKVDALITIGDAVGVCGSGRVVHVLWRREQNPISKGVTFFLPFLFPLQRQWWFIVCWLELRRTTHKIVAGLGTSSDELISGAVVSERGTT